jgi:hypothetical protein
MQACSTYSTCSTCSTPAEEELRSRCPCTGHTLRMRTITCMWAVPWKGGGTAARLKGEGLGTDHATWLIGRRCVACSRTLLGPCVASSLLGMLYGSRGALGPSWGRAWQHREVPCSRARVPVFVSENHRRMHRRRGCSKGAGSTRTGIQCLVCACDVVWTLSQGDVGTCGRCLRAPRAPPALECGSSGARACARGRGARWIRGVKGPHWGVVYARCTRRLQHKVKDMG